MARLNAIGANVRSRLFGWPYGDQGFCMSKSTFDKIGPYPEDAIMGEDLLHIRIAKKRGVTLSRIPSKLQTSARKYIERGWLKLTILRLYHMIQLLRTPL